jgi:glycosyltransferase involved in cell wall biosynthesis
MSQHLPRICVFGVEGITLRSTPSPPSTETNELACRCFQTDSALEKILIDVRPHVIVSIGELSDFPLLNAAPFEVRRRWLHYPSADDLEKIGSDAFLCYLAVCLDARPEEPLVSIFTPAYRTGSRFVRTYKSVMAQTYSNWEWIIYDDSGDNDKTADMIASFAERDHRIRIIRTGINSGIIGEVKYNACMASTGELLLELDHDDALTPHALWNLVKAARAHPDCGFFYSDFAEVDSNLQPLRYPDGWGHGYGKYRLENYQGFELAVAEAPNINPKTIRGLVAAPNHLRAWRRSTYFSIGGHNRLLSIADDMELLIRTFLATKMVRIPKLCYLQFQDGTNTQTVRNRDIQRHVRYLAWKYDRRIHDRFVELGINDFVWLETEQRSDLSIPNPLIEPVASIIAGA